MARLYLRKTVTGFTPHDDPSRELWAKYKINEVYRAEIVKPRSYQHHKLVLGLLTKTYENLPEELANLFVTFKSFRNAVCLESGHVETYCDLKGVLHTDPRSISYDEIPDDVDFGAVAAAMMTVCANILGVDEAELAAEMAQYADDHYGR